MTRVRNELSWCEIYHLDKTAPGLQFISSLIGPANMYLVPNQHCYPKIWQLPNAICNPGRKQALLSGPLYDWVSAVIQTPHSSLLVMLCGPVQLSLHNLHAAPSWFQLCPLTTSCCYFTLGPVWEAGGDDTNFLCWEFFRISTNNRWSSVFHQTEFNLKSKRCPAFHTSV